LSACKSCGQPIRWLATPTGGKMPVDAHTAAPQDRVFNRLAGHISHFATCPSAAKHRKRQSRR
jgi:hypothetical protein